MDVAEFFFGNPCVEFSPYPAPTADERATALADQLRQALTQEADHPFFRESLLPQSDLLAWLIGRYSSI